MLDREGYERVTERAVAAAGARDALRLSPGDDVEFAVNAQGEVVIQKSGSPATRRTSGTRDRFETVRGKAQVKWRTDDLMALLRGPD